MYMISHITRYIEGDCNTLSAVAFEGEPLSGAGYQCANIALVISLHVLVQNH